MTLGQICWEAAWAGADCGTWDDVEPRIRVGYETGAQAVICAWIQEAHAPASSSVDHNGLIDVMAGLLREVIDDDLTPAEHAHGADWLRRATNALSWVQDGPVRQAPGDDTPKAVDAPTGLSAAQQAICRECDTVLNMLLEKNRKYGNSAIDPVRVFSRADPVEQIKVRIDDKLSRLASRQADDDEDVTLDLIGYLILLRVAKCEPFLTR